MMIVSVLVDHTNGASHHVCNIHNKDTIAIAIVTGIVTASVFQKTAKVNR